MTRYLAYALAAAFFGLDLVAREGREAASLSPSEADRRSTQLLVAGYATAASGSVLLGRVPGRLPRSAGWVGVGLMAAGIGIRWWAMRTLGGFYTRTLRVADGQPVVETGPYAVVRHPGYLGSLLVWTGFGLASRSLPAAIGAAAPMAIAYRHRMAAEEAMLEARLGEPYRRYEGRTWRLLPYVY